MAKKMADGVLKTIVGPTGSEEKLYHDNRYIENRDEVGNGDGEVGDVIGEEDPEGSEQGGGGQGTGGQGEGGGHEIDEKALDLGRALMERFQLPNLEEKGKKRSLSDWKYELT